MIIPRSGAGIVRRGIIPVVIVGRVYVADKIWMRCLHPVINDAYTNAAPANASAVYRIGPDALNVKICS